MVVFLLTLVINISIIFYSGVSIASAQTLTVPSFITSTPSLYFDGMSTYVSLPSAAPQFTNFSNGITLQAWVLTDSLNTTSTGWDRIIELGNGSCGGAWTGVIEIGEYGSGNNLEYLAIPNNNNILIASNAISLYTWQNFAVTQNSSGLATIYINGVPVANTTMPLPIVTQRTLNYIGNNIQNSLYNGLIKDVSIWNTALSQSQIQYNMENQLTGDEAGLVACYPLDNQSQGAQDISPNHLNGTIEGYQSWSGWVQGTIYTSGYYGSGYIWNNDNYNVLNGVPLIFYTSFNLSTNESVNVSLCVDDLATLYIDGKAEMVYTPGGACSPTQSYNLAEGSHSVMIFCENDYRLYSPPSPIDNNPAGLYVAISANGSTLVSTANIKQWTVLQYGTSQGQYFPYPFGGTSQTTTGPVNMLATFYPNSGIPVGPNITPYNNSNFNLSSSSLASISAINVNNTLDIAWPQNINCSSISILANNNNIATLPSLSTSYQIIPSQLQPGNNQIIVQFLTSNGIVNSVPVNCLLINPQSQPDYFLQATMPTGFINFIDGLYSKYISGNTVNCYLVNGNYTVVASAS